MNYLTQAPAALVLSNPSDPRSNHRDVMALFGDLENDHPRQSAGILFRVEPRGDFLLVRSNLVPENPVDGMRTIAEPAAPAEGSMVQFRLAVNAITRDSRVGKSASKPVPEDSFEVDLEQTMTGFVGRKLAGALTDVQLLRHYRELLTERNRSKRGVTTQVDTVDGVATVQDVQRLEELLSVGVGRAKAYGCGLLTVRKVG